MAKVDKLIVLIEAQLESLEGVEPLVAIAVPDLELLITYIRTLELRLENCGG